MDMKKMDWIIPVAIIVIIAGIGIFFGLRNKKEEVKPREEAVIFKEEYEKLNETDNGNGGTHRKVEIGSDNNIYYTTEEEAVKLLTEGTSIVYFGYAACPWCRNLVPELLTATKNAGIEKVYYLDIQEIRSTYEVQNRKAVMTKEGSAGYYKILEAMDEVLDTFVITDSKGKEYKTPEKRLYAPTVVFVKEGEIIGVHVGTLDSQNNPAIDLTKEQKEELNGILTGYINKVIEACDDAC